MPGAFKGYFWGIAAPGTPEGMLSSGKTHHVCYFLCDVRQIEHPLSWASAAITAPMLFEYVIQIYYFSLAPFLPLSPAYNWDQHFLCYLFSTHVRGQENKPFYSKRQRIFCRLFMFTRYFPPQNVEAQLLKCYLYRNFQFLLFIPNLHHLGLLCFWVSSWFVVQRMNYLHMPKKAQELPSIFQNLEKAGGCIWQQQ